MTQIVLPFPPSTNTYYRKWNNRMVIGAAGRAYKKAVAAIWPKAVAKLDGPVALDVVLVAPDRKRRDIDNFAGKALLDALKGLAYTDDSQVWWISARWMVSESQERALLKGGLLHLGVRHMWPATT